MLLSVVLTTLVQELFRQIEKSYKKLIKVIKLLGIGKRNDPTYYMNIDSLLWASSELCNIFDIITLSYEAE
jgi:hypothetical protein